MDDRRDVYNQMDRETDEYGNPRRDTAASGGVTGGTDYGTPGATGYGDRDVGEKWVMDKIKEKMPGSHTTDTGYPHGKEHQKRGTMEKIKEKMPGTHTAGTGTTDTGYAEEHGKKGTVEKIKEKLPGTGRHS